MTEDNAINFMLYSLLGVTLESNVDQLLEAAINRAYRDASSHVLSVKEEEKEEESPRELATKKIKEEILKNLKGQEYNKWHNNLCYSLIALYNGKTFGKYKFTYGIAQKWINMTMKYLFVLRSIYEKYEVTWSSDLKFLDDKEFEKNLHIPIDGYIIDAAWSDECVVLPLKDNAKRKKQYKHPHEYVKAWSTWNIDTADDMADEKKPCKDYKNFQDTIEKCTDGSPLDWENKKWIEIAEQRKAEQREKSKKISKIRKKMAKL